MLRVAVLLFLASIHTSRAAGCSGELTNSSSQITSPNYPDNYPPNSTCEYTITTDPDKVVILMFQNFTLESDCNNDYLEIGDIGVSKVWRFCGTSLPPEIRSSQNSLFLRFKTDHSKEYNGFEATYSTTWLMKNVSVTPMTSSSVRVHWESPHPSVNNYTVHVTPLARRHSPPPGCPALPPPHSAFSVTVNGSSTETNITLPPDLEFQVSVRGESLDVPILPSDVVTSYTLPAASEPVRDLSSVLRDKATNITVTWKAPCDTGGVLSHFMVILEPDRKHQNVQNYIFNQTVTQPLQDSFSITTILSNLTAECQYDVTVIPVGLTGLYGANWTTSFQVPARGLMKNVSVTPVTSSSVRVHWESPHPSVNNYTVHVTPLARRHSPPPGCPALPPPHSAFSVTVNGSSTETNITLPPDLEFHVTVSAESLDVPILPSDVVTGYTLPAASEPVRDLSSVLRDNATNITVTWKAPCDTGGVLSHFMVILEPDRKHQNVQNYIFNQTVTQPLQDSFSITTILSNLTAECQYDVTVIPVGLTGLYGANWTTSFQVPAREPTTATDKQGVNPYADVAIIAILVCVSFVMFALVAIGVLLLRYRGLTIGRHFVPT